MKGQIHKAYKVLLKLQNPKYFKKDKGIPLKVIQQAKGLAFVTVIKAGLVFSGTIGSGIVIARLPNGEWSGPSSIGVGGMGWGALFGASSTDSVIILNNEAAVKAFSGKGQVKFGGNLSVAVGPLGREGDASVYGGDGGATACYSYSHSRGLFGGLSLQGALMGARDSDNAKFYGQKCTPGDILKGKIAPPPNEDLTNLIRCLNAIDNERPIQAPESHSGDFSNSTSSNNQRDSPGYPVAGTGYINDNSLGPAVAAAVSHTSNSHPFERNAVSRLSELPKGWKEVETKDGEKYYWNEQTNSTQWQRPALPSAPASAAISAPSLPPAVNPFLSHTNSSSLPIGGGKPVSTHSVETPAKQPLKIPERPVAVKVPSAVQLPVVPNQYQTSGVDMPQLPKRPPAIPQRPPAIPRRPSANSAAVPPVPPR